MSEEYPTMVTNKKDAVCMKEFILTVLYFRKLIDLKTADKEWKKLARKWNLKSTHKENK
jgi:hypothetical protein